MNGPAVSQSHTEASDIVVREYKAWLATLVSEAWGRKKVY